MQRQQNCVLSRTTGGKSVHLILSPVGLGRRLRAYLSTPTLTSALQRRRLGWIRRPAAPTPEMRFHSEGIAGRRYLRRPAVLLGRVRDQVALSGRCGGAAARR